MKKYSIIVSETAINDIIEIYSYISNELLNVEAAERLVEKLKAYIEELSYMPCRNSLIRDDELKSKGVRRTIVDNYIIFYICSDRDLSVSIIRVLYNKREWEIII